jgi:hypothetical protein
MGHIVIEIPEKENHFYRLHNEDTIKKLLSDLEQITAKEREDDDEDILGLWTMPEPIKRAANQ